MEKINITFYGDLNSNLIYLKDILDDSSNKSCIYTPEGIDLPHLSYSVFNSLLQQEKEFFCSIYANNINFLITSDIESYIDVYRKDNELAFLLSFFIETILVDMPVKNKLEYLFKICKAFSDKFNFSHFNCKLYEDDDDFFFNSSGFGNLYHEIKEGSDKLI